MALFDASATVLGSSSAAAIAVVRIIGAATCLGGSTFGAQVGVLQLSSAWFVASSFFTWDHQVEASASFLGTSAAGASGHAAVESRATFRGDGFFLHGALLPIQGTSAFSVASLVDAHPPPIKAITMGPKRFRWLQPLQRGDLSVFICDGRSAVVPSRIAYSLAFVRLDGSRRYVGPQNRTPVSGDVGEFYATGRAGESGQPGQWVIEWVYQRTPHSDAQRAEMAFHVLDAVALADPREQLARKVKFGWS
jgi:hypothetical protein